MQIGETSNSSDKLKIILNDLHTDVLIADFTTAIKTGVKDDRDRYTINISKQSIASVAADETRTAINEISSFRAKLGAQYNRLTSTINTSLIASDNISNAKSRIKDTDYAQSMSDYVKSDILNQSSAFIIHQSNNLLSEALKLLQQ